jgi:hypothetical protein
MFDIEVQLRCRVQMRRSDREALGVAGTVERTSWHYFLYVVTFAVE